ncbi:MAG: hypothetical protein JM58_08140 [Peptococcaceae bacterium BICA1-8]|nr:MAG: hypothetical protein JM58_08140 [Peptococcaceae bacterium BICA1-8]
MLTFWDRMKLLIFGAPLEGEDSLTPISMDKRSYNLLDTFLMFAGTQIAISFFVVGAGTVQGETVLRAFIAVLLGYGLIGGLLVGFVGRIGFKEGIPTMVATRPSFGIRGSLLPVLVTFVELGGWAAVQIALGGNALYLLLVVMNKGWEGTGLAIFSALFVGICTLLIATRGGVAIKKMSLFVVPLLLVATLYIAFIALGNHSFFELLNMKNEGNSNMLYIFDVMVISALTWAPMAADYTRLGKTSSGSRNGILLAFIFVTPAMHLIGMISSVGLGVPNPITALGSTGLGGMIALFTILFATLTTAVLILYSTAMAGINVVESFGKKITLWQAALIIGLPAIILSTRMEVIFFVIPWLEWLGIGLAPIFGVMLFDYFFIHRNGFITEELYNEEKSRYWGHKGFNLAGYGAAILGGIIYYLVMHYVKPVQPWVMASLVSMVISGVVYLLLMKTSLNISNSTTTKNI